MKNTTFLILALFSFALSQAQVVNIPDADFKAALLGYQPAIDTNHDNQIQVSEALAMTSLNFISENYIGNSHDLTGLEAFSNLTSLSLVSYYITNLDVSGLNNLQNLQCNCSYLLSLNLSGLVNLQSLNCASCYQITSLNLAGLSNLQSLNCAGCSQITSLNLAGLSNLHSLDCSNCSNLNALDATASPGLQTLYCNACYRVTSLNISGLSNLTSLSCHNIDGLTNLSLTGLTNLQTLDCSDTYHLATLDLTGLSNLTYLNCSQGQLTSLITTGANNITTLNCSNNQLTSLSVSGMTNLQVLDCNYQTDFAIGGGITSLDLTGLTNITRLNCSSNNLSSLDVSHLTGLTNLNCNYNHIATLNVAPLVNLTSLSCGGNQLQTLDVSTLTHLTYLDCFSNLLNALNINAQTALTSMSCSHNSIDALDVSHNTALTFLACAENELTTLDITNLASLERIICSSNQLTTMDFSNSHNLTNVQIGGNLFSNLDLSQSIIPVNMSIHHYTFDSCPNLTHINLKNGAETLIHLDFSAYNCPLLQYVCSDEFDIQGIQQGLEYLGDFSTTPDNVSVNSYCTFVPGGIHNTINGTVTLDSNNNGCDAGDIHPRDFRININDGIQSGATFSGANGNYSFFTQDGNFDLTPQFENSYFTITPATSTINFPTLDGSTQTRDYCITANGIHNDVEITIIPQSARPGFDSSYILIYKNKGNQMLSGSINFVFDDAVLDFVSATPPLDNQSLNNLSWNYTNLLPFESRLISLTLNLNGPTETPAVNIGDILNFSGTISPVVNDETIDDNTFAYTQTVRGSFDPNDKICLEGDFITPEKVGDYLHYIIHFQNSGTAPAENIVVKDILDTTKFDLSTLELTRSSHPQVTRITDNKVEFVFEGINLPAEIDDEPGSHGYVAFKIKTKNNLVLGNTISNTANIYFDYNFPIVTNTATATVSNLHNHDFENTSVSISPNPVKSILSISAKDLITSVQLFDVQGRVIATELNASMETNLDLSQQQSGVYFVKVYTDNGMKVQKVIKQ